jgi:high affinity Mn2+ porin
VVVTVGKWSVVDVVDTNRDAHDPKNAFLNWSMIAAGACD